MMEFVFERVENRVGNGENACNHNSSCPIKEEDEPQ